MTKMARDIRDEEEEDEEEEEAVIVCVCVCVCVLDQVPRVRWE
jgi:hypothetical protein